MATSPSLVISMFWKDNISDYIDDFTLIQLHMVPPVAKIVTVVWKRLRFTGSDVTVAELVRHLVVLPGKMQIWILFM